MSEEVRAHFDRVAAVYESNRLGPWYIGHGAFIADQITQSMPAGSAGFRMALDVGCGTGWLLRELRRRKLIERGIGLDLSEEMVRSAIDRARTSTADPRDASGSALEFHRCNWSDPGDDLRARLLEAGPDLVLFASSLHYASEPGAWLKLAFDTMATGGRIAVLERAPERSVATRLWGRIHELLLRDGVRFFTTADVRAELRAAGFADVETVAYLHRWLWRGKLVTSMALSTGVKRNDGGNRT